MGKRTNTAHWTGTRWRIDVQQGGERRSFYSSIPGRRGQREANAKADEWLDNGIQDSAMRAETAYLAFLEHLKQTTSRGNWRPAESRFRAHVAPVLGSKRLQAVTEMDLQRVIDRAYSAGLAAKTLRNLRADLLAWSKYCRRAKLATLAPDELTIPRSARRGERKILQPADLRTLFTVDTTLWRGQRVPDEYIHAYRLQVLTGLRPGELIGLRWADVVNGRLHLGRSINIDGEQTAGKNENARRVVPLSLMAAAELEAQRLETGADPQVFPIRSESHYRQRWKIYSAANGLTITTPYELRHTFVSVAKRLPAGMVKDMVGHSQSMDTFGVYAHLLEGDRDETAAAVNALFAQLLK